MTRPACRHCRRGVVCRPRGLCWPCHKDPAVRRLYPPKVDRRHVNGQYKCAQCGHECWAKPLGLPPGWRRVYVHGSVYVVECVACAREWDDYHGGPTLVHGRAAS